MFTLSESFYIISISINLKLQKITIYYSDSVSCYWYRAATSMDAIHECKVYFLYVRVNVCLSLFYKLILLK